MLRYFGAKARLAEANEYQMPDHPVIVEPFAGMAWYAMRWAIERPTLEVVLVEKNPQVVELWHRLLAMTPQEIAAYPIPEAGTKSTDLIIGTASAQASSFGSVADGQGYFVVTERMVADAPAVLRKAAWVRGHVGPERVTIIEGDYTDAPDIEATWFVDPPYQHQGSLYRFGSEGIDFDHLGDWCQNRRGQVIVTEAHPADWLPFQPLKTHADQSNGENVEVVWYSHPPATLFDMEWT